MTRFLVIIIDLRECEVETISDFELIERMETVLNDLEAASEWFRITNDGWSIQVEGCGDSDTEEV